MIDGNLVFPFPPDEIINKRAYPASDLPWGRGILRWNGRCRTGGGTESQFDCQVFFSDFPLKNMMDGNLVFPFPPDDIIKNQRTRRWNYCGEEVYRGGMGAGGQWAALKPI